VLCCVVLQPVSGISVISSDGRRDDDAQTHRDVNSALIPLVYCFPLSLSLPHALLSYISLLHKHISHIPPSSLVNPRRRSYRTNPKSTTRTQPTYCLLLTIPTTPPHQNIPRPGIRSHRIPKIASPSPSPHAYNTHGSPDPSHPVPCVHRSATTIA
jgi:hypothetical protein